LAVAVLAACAGIPVDGVVESQDRFFENGAANPEVAALPPPQGATPADIINGFLGAIAAFEIDYATARLYLTPQAAAAWRPQAGELVVYADRSPDIAAEPDAGGVTSAILRAAEVGRLQPDRSFHSSDEIWSHDFRLVLDDSGQWRISQPPDQLVISHYLFTTLYAHLDAYFFEPAEKALVPDPRWVPKPELTVQTAVELVLGGPSAWLGGVVEEAPPAVLADGGVQVTGDSWAVVSLTASAAALSVPQRRFLALQCAATLRGVQSIAGVRLQVDGRDLVLDETGVAALPVASLDAFDTAQSPAASRFYGLQDGLLVVWPEDESALRPESGPAWEGAETATSLAVSADASQVALAAPEGLLSGLLNGEPERLAAPPEPRRVQFDRDGLWALDAGGQFWFVAADGPQAVPVLDSKGDPLTVQSFRLAADGLRLALVVADPKTGRSQLGLVLVNRAGGTPAVDSWSPIRLWDTADAMITDVAWLGPSALAVIGSSAAANPVEVHRVDSDGVNLTDLGRPFDTTLTALATPVQAAATQLVVLGADGKAWRYVDTYQWTQVGENLAAVAYPG
jgi:hypothetical protein